MSPDAWDLVAIFAPVIALLAAALVAVWYALRAMRAAEVALEMAEAAQGAAVAARQAAARSDGSALLAEQAVAALKAALKEHERANLP